MSEIEELRALPEAQLTYPGSEEVDRGGRGTTPSITGPQPAFAWRLLGTDASPEEVFAWYAAELEADGWVTGGGSSRARGTSELQATAWERDELIVRLAVLDPGRTRPDLQGAWAYLYRTDVIVARDTQ